MRAEREPDLALFTERVRAFLGREPVVHTVICGVLALAERDPRQFESSSWFTVSGPGGGLAGVAMRVPPYPVAITPMPDEALDVLVGLVATELPDVPGVAGPQPYVDRFAARWRQRTGAEPSVKRQTRLFRLDEVTPPVQADGPADGQPRPAGGQPRPAGGRLRPAAELPEYRELFAGWVRAFALEIDGEEPPEPAAFVQRLLNRGSLWVWCDPEPVSFASTTVPAYATTRVGLVYTPKELRGRGYASACVAAMSQNALDDGLAPVLFTDLANPTSNRIYQQIGYRPVADFCEYTFG